MACHGRKWLLILGIEKKHNPIIAILLQANAHSQCSFFCQCAEDQLSELLLVPQIELLSAGIMSAIILILVSIVYYEVRGM